MIELKKEGRPQRVTGHAFSKDQLVVLAYCDELRDAGLLDFDLILTEFRRLLSKDSVMRSTISQRFSHLLVDEVQDMNDVDWDIVESLPIANKFLVGDPDQSIYGFRGACVERLVAFAKRPEVEVIALEENFRCADEVCAAANRLITRNTDRVQKWTRSVSLPDMGIVAELGAHGSEGVEVANVTNLVAELMVGPATSAAVLCRSNAIANEFRKALHAEGLQVEEEPKLDIPEDWALARALIEFLAQPQNDTLGFFYVAAREVRKGAKPVEARKYAAQVRRDANAQGRTINAQWFAVSTAWVEGESLASISSAIGQFMHREGLTRESCARVVGLIMELGAGASLSDLALAVARDERPAPNPKDAKGLFVGTIHAAKGREWDVVYLVGFEDEVTPGKAKSANVEEERRLAFVGITRARREVWFSHSLTRRGSWPGAPLERHTKSRFIGEALA